MKEDLRPCIVTIIEWDKKPIDRRVFPEKRKAYFHGWTGKKNILGVVEYEDGRIDTVKPMQIAFSDKKIELSIDSENKIITEGDICEFGKNETALMYVTLGSGRNDEDRYVEGFYLTGGNKGHIGRFKLKELRKTDKHFDIDNIMKNVCTE